jgi:DNA polymerase-1
LFDHLEFKSWVTELGGASTAGAVAASSTSASSEQAPATPALTIPDAIEANYTIITEQSVLDEWIKKLAAAPLFSFDTETTSLDIMDARIVGVSFVVTIIWVRRSN